MDVKLIDSISYLQSREIEYKTGGKNVSRGWTNINCPYCEDSSNHLGINLTSNLFHCWICGEKGSIIRLASALEKCSFGKAQRVLSEFKLEDIRFDEERIRKVRGDILPKCASDLQEMHIRYLKKRRFNARQLTKKYKLKGCGIVGKYKFRLIVPVIINSQIVSFQARDVSGKAKIPYRKCPDEEAILPDYKCLYNLDNIKGKTVGLVEGFFDTWRIGDNIVGLFGKKITISKALMLHRRGVKRAVIIGDADATEEIRRDAERFLAPVIPELEQIELSRGDPDEMNYKDIQKVRRIIDGR